MLGLARLENACFEIVRMRVCFGLLQVQRSPGKCDEHYEDDYCDEGDDDGDGSNCNESYGRGVLVTRESRVCSSQVFQFSKVASDSFALEA